MYYNYVLSYFSGSKFIFVEDKYDRKKATSFSSFNNLLLNYLHDPISCHIKIVESSSKGKLKIHILQYLQFP